MCNEQHHLYTLICMCHGYKTRNIVYRYLRVARELAPANKNTEPSRVLCICTAAKSHQVPYHKHAHTHTHTHTEGTVVAQWLRRCATNRKVTGSIRDDVIGIFH